MTTQQDTRTRVVHAASDAAAATDGVAFLRPGLADLVRGTGNGARKGTTRSRAPGVRARRTHDPEGWHVQLHLAVLRGHQAAAVTRAVRAAVETAVRGALAGPPPRVTVTVTVTDIT
ncbi:Asp23/Gls24 family envelope stress response protein [Streptomyces armeniacus]|uniref:Asp23/Gls24 family envelope stress response protein n=1 Tax=Streptomyces armeniacus TaxID=83291 RepID=UPI001AD83853|nr:Asp23/Gls24 family envelope stress response protein [Streptomyces armeniacus]